MLTRRRRKHRRWEIERIEVADYALRRVATLAKRTIETSSGKVDSATMREFDCPSYDADVQIAGFPTWC